MMAGFLTLTVDAIRSQFLIKKVEVLQSECDIPEVVPCRMVSVSGKEKKVGKELGSGLPSTKDSSLSIFGRA